MTITVKELVQGIVKKDIYSKVYTINDGIDALSNINIEVVDTQNFVEYDETDVGAITILDANGDVNSASIGNANDIVFSQQEFNISRPFVKVFEFGRDKFDEYGINPDMLDTPITTDSAAAINSMMTTGRLGKKLALLYKKFYQRRRDQVHAFLDELGNTSTAYQKTIAGDQLIADNRTGHAYDFDNKGTAALSESEAEIAIDALAKQIDATGVEVGEQAPQFLFHVGSSTLARKILKPDAVINANYRSAADFKNGVSGFKMAGSYTSTSSKHWVMIGDKHEITRLIYKGYENFKIRVFHDVNNDKIKIEMSDWSILKCTSPVALYKGILS